MSLRAMQKPKPRHSDQTARVKWGYHAVIDKMHELARELEAAGQDNFAAAVRLDADAYAVRMKLNLRKLETANDNGGSHETH